MTYSDAVTRLIHAVKVDQGVFFQTRTGFPRRSYMSQSDADLHDKGYFEYAMGHAPSGVGPYLDGQWSAFAAEEESAMDSLEVESDEEEQ